MVLERIIYRRSSRYVSLRFSRVRQARKECSRFEGSRPNFPSDILPLRKYAQLSPLWSPQKSQNAERDPICKKGLGRRKDGALWPTAKIVGNWGGVTCPFAVDQLSLGRIRRTRTVFACFPFSAFLASLQRAGPPWTIHETLMRAFANDALSELETSSIW